MILLAGHYRPVVEEWISTDPYSRLRWALAAFSVVFVLPVWAFAAHFWRMGNQVVLAERFPAPDASVIRDTVVLHGPAARRRGRLIKYCAAILAVLAAGFCILLWGLLLLLEPSTTHSFAWAELVVLY